MHLGFLSHLLFSVNSKKKKRWKTFIQLLQITNINGNWKLLFELTDLATLSFKLPVEFHAIGRTNISEWLQACHNTFFYETGWMIPTGSIFHIKKVYKLKNITAPATIQAWGLCALGTWEAHHPELLSKHHKAFGRMTKPFTDLHKSMISSLDLYIPMLSLEHALN